MNKWIINKYGFINFWLFDDEQLMTSKGNLLLNGENGSGKSVTLQSFIPLILDGNTSSNRLSTEGDMSRKIDYYILFGNKEENISYLYAEFVKEYMGKKEYVTFGIGFKMRRGQARPSKWYFSLKDLRVGEDVKFYKQEKGYKYTFNKQELKKTFEDKAEDKFRIFESVEEYKNEVNNVLFGFPNMEEYEETLNLILELRKPSLKDSSGFDPKFIYDILNNSLKTLPEGELFNMSESFGNMEKISKDLKTIAMENEALKKIELIYKKYNELVLKERLDNYIKAYNELERGKKELENLKIELERSNEIIEKNIIRIEKLSHEKISKEKRILELNSNKEFSDIQNNYELVKKEIEGLEIEKKTFEEQSKKYKELLEKTEKSLEEEEKEKNKNLDKLEYCIKKIEVLKKELCFESIVDFEDFLNLEKSMDISIIEKEFKEFESKLRKVVELVKENKDKKGNLESIISYKSADEERLIETRKEYNEILKLMNEKKEDLIEKIKDLNEKNEIMYLNKENIGDIEEIIFEDEEKTGKEQTIEYTLKIKDTKKNEFMKEIYEFENRKKQVEIDLKNTEIKKQYLEKEKDIEFELKEEFVNQRKKLQIGEYSELYKAVKFRDNVDKETRGKIEKALLDSGILEAILSKKIEEEIYDKFLIKAEIKDQNLFKYLEPESGVFDYLIVENLLKSISTNKDENLYISPDGTYKMGLLFGKASKEYKAKYIGVEERKELKKEKIKILEEEIKNYKKDLYLLEINIEDLIEKRDKLENEFKDIINLIQKSEIENIKKKIEENIYKEKNLKENIKRWEKKQEDVKEKIEEIEKKINEILIINRIKLVDYNLAEKNLSDFKTFFRELSSEYTGMKSILRNLNILKETFENQSERYDELRKNINKVKLELKESEEKKKAYGEKLENDEYKNFKKEIEDLQNRVNVEIPNLLEEIRDKKIRREEAVKTIKIRINAYNNASEKNEIEYGIYKYLLDCEFENDYILLNEEFKEIKDKERLRDRLRKRLGVETNKHDCFNDLARVINEENKTLANYHFELKSYEYEYSKISSEKLEIELYIRRTLSGKVNSKKAEFTHILIRNTENMEATDALLTEEERRFFEDFLFNEVGRDINKRVKESIEWVNNIDEIMNTTPTSSGKKYKLKWDGKIVDQSEGIKADSFVQILGNKHSKDGEKIKNYFKSKMKQAQNDNKGKNGGKSNFELIKEILDYRNWYEFKLIVMESGGKEYNLTKKRLNSYSGGEKVMAVYIPLFSALYARFVNARKDGLKIVSMDEAFSVVDDENIEKLFAILEHLEINYLLASQKLTGTYKTVKDIAIVHIENPVSKQLVKPEDGYVSLIKYVWNGVKKEKDLRGASEKLF